MTPGGAAILPSLVKTPASPSEALARREPVPGAPPVPIEAFWGRRPERAGGSHGPPRGGAPRAGAALLVLLAGLAGLLATRRRPPPSPSPSPAELTVVIEAPTPAGEQRLENLLRGRLRFARSDACPFTPPGTSTLRSITLPGAELPTLRRALDQESIPLLSDSLVRGTQDPNDPEFPAQWGLRNRGGDAVGSTLAVAGIDVGAPCAWQYLQDHPPGSGLPLYALVIDVGAAEVADLQGVFATLTGPPGGGPHGVDLIDHDREPLIPALAPPVGLGALTLAQSHGTMTAGILAARTHNALGIAGALGPASAPRFGLVAARVLRVDAAAQVVGKSADTVCALRYGAVLAAWLRQRHLGRLVAVNLSLTDAHAPAGLRALYEEAFAALAAEEVLVLAATGNTDPGDPTRCVRGPQYPSTSAAPNVLAVGGVDPAGGPVYCRGAGQVAVAAPAFAIRATTAIAAGAGATHACQGTSCAAPLATAVALLVAAARPALGAAALRSLLIRTALPVAALDGAVSAGVVNACRAVHSPP